MAEGDVEINERIKMAKDWMRERGIKDKFIRYRRQLGLNTFEGTMTISQLLATFSGDDTKAWRSK
jgi:hypothetical protein